MKPPHQTPHMPHRMTPRDEHTNPCEGVVKWSPVKSLWFSGHLLLAIFGGWATFSLGAAVVSFVFTVAIVCLGNTVGLHRLLIHRSFRCPRVVELFLIHCGTVVGMGGPLAMIFQHDSRDWAQRHANSHPFYLDARPAWRDALWQLHCELKLTHPPRFTLEPELADDWVLKWMQRTWMLQQLPWVALLYALGGWGWVIWGTSVRIVTSITGHWLICFLVHNGTEGDYYLQGHAVQGSNLPKLSLLTMGEGWHNNHHAFPESARLGIQPHQWDPGWWVICLLKRLGWAKNLVLPEDLPPRPERLRIDNGG